MEVGEEKSRSLSGYRAKSGRTRESPPATWRSQSGQRLARTSGGSARRDGAVSRDALLQTLFPNGVPPRESVIRDLNAWLDEAERLARRS